MQGRRLHVCPDCGEVYVCNERRIVCIPCVNRRN